jgi:hypothetical protein
MAGRPCSICSSADKLQRAAQMIGAGATDQAIADALDVGRMSVSRHRREHVVAPAKALADAAGKGREVAEQRAQVMAAAEAGDPAAFVALSGIVADLRKVNDRLERTAEAAENDKQRLAVASLSAQQLRAAEVRGKIGGVGAFAPVKAAGFGERPMLDLKIIFSGHPDKTINITPILPEAAAGAAAGRTFDLIPDTAVPRTIDATAEEDDADTYADEDV